MNSTVINLIHILFIDVACILNIYIYLFPLIHTGKNKNVQIHFVTVFFILCNIGKNEIATTKTIIINNNRKRLSQKNISQLNLVTLVQFNFIYVIYPAGTKNI